MIDETRIQQALRQGPPFRTQYVPRPLPISWEVSRRSAASLSWVLILITILLAIALGGAVLIGSGVIKPPASLPGSWSAAGAMTTHRQFHTATRLLDDRVLVAGGACCLGAPASAEIYDPASGTWSATGPMTERRGGHTATLLPDGRLLVVGGSVGGPRALASAEIYDPATGTWSATAPLAEARSGHTATLLPDGRVLVAGGFVLVDGSSRPGRSLASAEIYDPATGTWSATGTMAEARGGHTATLLPDGRVLVAGGSPDSVLAGGGPLLTLASAELYDPIRRSWTAAASMDESRFGFAAVLLEDGTVLVAGGWPATAALYDPAGIDVPGSVGCPSDPLAACASATPISTPAPAVGSTATSNPTVSPSAVQTSAPIVAK